MIAKKNSKKIVKYKKYIGINIGTLLFGIVFVYMMVCIVMYLTSTHIAPYEVKKGSLSGNYKYTALALKSETVVEAPESGAVTYYAREGTEIGKNGVICSINENGTTRTERTSASQKARNCLKVQQKVPLRQKQRLKVQMRKRMHCKLQILPKAEHYLPQMQKNCVLRLPDMRLLFQVRTFRKHMI